MLFMLIETYRSGDPVPVYQRFRDCGRQATPGLEYRGSWVTTDRISPVGLGVDLNFELRRVPAYS